MTFLLYTCLRRETSMYLPTEKDQYISTYRERLVCSCLQRKTSMYLSTEKDQYTPAYVERLATEKDQYIPTYRERLECTDLQKKTSISLPTDKDQYVPSTLVGIFCQSLNPGIAGKIRASFQCLPILGDLSQSSSSRQVT